MIDNIIYKNLNGINVATINKKGFINKQVMICFNYGSKDNIINYNGENKKLPDGIAHFLEHKMFEAKNYDAFDTFTKLGASVNAFTSFSSTCYYAFGIENFNEILKELLKMVSTPYFTYENVEKEKPIIAQEIKMYEDDPYFMVYFNLIRIMYNYENPITKDITGKIDDIKKINENDIKFCYDNFYTKSNSIIICIGEFNNIDELYDIVLKNFSINEKMVANISTYDERCENVAKKHEQKMDLKQKIFNIGFKYKEICGKINENIVANKIILDIAFGKSSKFYEDLCQKNLLDNSFSFDYTLVSNFGFSILSGASKDENEILHQVDNTLSNIKLDEIDFNRIKNKFINEFIRDFNSIDNIINLEADFFSRSSNSKDYYDALVGIQFEEVEKAIPKIINTLYLSTIT